MFDLSAEIQRVDGDISRISAEKEKIARSLTENTTKTNEQIAKLAASIASLQTSRQRLQDFMGFDQKLSELAALKAEHATCTAKINAALADAAAKAEQIATLNGTIAARDGTIITLNGTIATRDAMVDDLNAVIVTLNARIADLESQLDVFTIYDEMRIGDTPQNMQPILFIYEHSLYPSGGSPTAAPDPAFLRSQFTNIKTANAGATMVVIDHEALFPGGDGSGVITNPQYLVTILTIAREFWPDVSLYSYPTRYYGFANPNSDPTRYDGLVSRTQATQAITDQCTFLSPSFYYLNPIHDNAVNRDNWINKYIDLCELVAPGKRIIPVILPRYHSSLASVPGYESWAQQYVDGDYWLATMQTIKARCPGLTIWMGTSNPDPRTESPVPLWWTRTVAFAAA